MPHTLILTDVKPSATPSDAEIAAWRDLPRDEQVRRMRQALTSPEAATPAETSMADIRADIERTAPSPAQAAAHIRELRRGVRLPEGETIRSMIERGRA